MLYFFCAWEVCLCIKLKYLEVLTDTLSLPEQFLLQCAEQLPHKIPFFGVLVCKYIYSKAYSILLFYVLFAKVMYGAIMNVMFTCNSTNNSLSMSIR